jgi:hypothetical protein
MSAVDQPAMLTPFVSIVVIREVISLIITARKWLKTIQNLRVVFRLVNLYPHPLCE